MLLASNQLSSVCPWLLTCPLLFHHCTRASCVYNGCLAWYNVVLIPRVYTYAQHSTIFTDGSKKYIICRI